MTFENLSNNLFEDQRKSKRLFKDLTNPRNKIHQKCMFSNCEAEAIQSHSISKNILKIINNEKVVYPVIDPCNLGNSVEDLENTTEPNIKFEKKEITNVSKFRGFCKKHDNDLFEKLDNYGINTQQDIFLQLYRTTCKFTFEMDKVQESEEKIFRYQYWSNSEYENKINLSINDLKLSLEDMLIDFPELKTKLNLNLSENLVIETISNTQTKKVFVLYTKIPAYFNFALEKDFILKLNGEIAHCVFVLLPGENYSNMMFVSSKEIINYILQQGITSSDIRILNILESIMIQDSKFYISPTIISNWGNEKLKMIIEDFFFCTERKFLQEYDISIFDQLRNALLNDKPDIVKEHELKKMNSLPQRKLFQERYQNYQYMTLKDRHSKLRYTGNKERKNYPIGPFEVI